MKFLLTRRRRLNPVYLAFMAVSFMVGIAGALQAPTLSLFLSREVGVTPFWVGLFYTVNAVAGITVSLLLAKRSDNRGDRRRLILFCCAMALMNALLFAFNRHYLSSVMRAQLSLAWVIGPPLSFALALNYGFTVMFIVAAGLFLVCLALVAFALPSVPRVEQSPEVLLTQISAWRDKDVRLLFVASMMMWTCNTMYIIDMPLYISSVLGLPERLAGLLMGTAAGLEIPIMLLAGHFVKRTGKRRIMLLAIASGVLFYLGLVLFQSRTVLMLIQIFNAIFIGIIAGIGMLWFQDLMPGRPGAATTLFTNSISTGTILAGLLQGTLAESFGHYAVYWLALGIATLAFALSTRVRNV
ncbi:MAG: MFS transporter [Pantoea sp.]|nr:MFS transporter [Pantoea sp.]